MLLFYENHFAVRWLHLSPKRGEKWYRKECKPRERKIEFELDKCESMQKVHGILLEPIMIIYIYAFTKRGRKKSARRQAYESRKLRVCTRQNVCNPKIKRKPSIQRFSGSAMERIAKVKMCNAVSMLLSWWLKSVRCRLHFHEWRQVNIAPAYYTHRHTKTTTTTTHNTISHIGNFRTLQSICWTWRECRFSFFSLWLTFRLFSILFIVFQALVDTLVIFFFS